MKNTVRTFQMAKEKGEKLTMLTAYDYSTARLMEEAGINAILVGDSLGNTMLGYEDTISVTVEDMIHHGHTPQQSAEEQKMPLFWQICRLCLIRREQGMHLSMQAVL